MKLIILGLKEKKTGNYFVYDVSGQKKHTEIGVNETKQIPILSPFPFSNFSSLDTFNERKFEKCYLEVEGELSENEFSSMKSGGIVYYRFFDREVTLLNDYQDIFQYALQMLKAFGKKLGTHDLTTWVMHNETKNEAEFTAMKQIILNAVTDQENKAYPLDISVDQYTLVYMDVFREFAAKGRKITFGRYGTNDCDVFKKTKTKFSDETFLYLLQNVRLYDTSYFEHPQFTPAFYEDFIKGTAFEEEFFYDLDEKDLLALKNKGFDMDVLYAQFYRLTLNKFNNYFPEYEGDFFRIFSDPDCAPYTKHTSPFDYYCCEDCDGYDIYEMYSEEELEGTEVLVDERLQYAQELIGEWGDFLAEESYSLFEKIPNDVLTSFPEGHFFHRLLVSRSKKQDA